MIAICEFLAPYNLHTRNVDFIYSPPQRVHFFHDGTFVGPFVYGRNMQLDMDTLKREYTDNKADVQKIRFFCRGDAYKFWGLFESDVHLVCPAEGGQMFLLGTDRLGRDVLSRIIYGARISLTIGLIGITVSFVLGIIIGGLAGYHGGVLDLIVQRIIEVLQSIPSIPLWMALAAIMPVTWSPIIIYFGITLILGMLDWTGLARAVRSKLLSLREEDYVLAAQLMGAQVEPHHRPAPGARLHVASDRHGDHLDPRHDPRRNGAELPRPGPAAADHQLGHPADRSAQRQRHRLLSLAAVADGAGGAGDPAFNFLGDGLRDAADPYKSRCGFPRRSAGRQLASAGYAADDGKFRSAEEDLRISRGLSPINLLGFMPESTAYGVIIQVKQIRRQSDRARHGGGADRLDHRRRRYGLEAADVAVHQQDEAAVVDYRLSRLAGEDYAAAIDKALAAGDADLADSLRTLAERQAVRLPAHSSVITLPRRKNISNTKN